MNGVQKGVSFGRIIVAGTMRGRSRARKTGRKRGLRRRQKRFTGKKNRTIRIKKSYETQCRKIDELFVDFATIFFVALFNLNVAF